MLFSVFDDAPDAVQALFDTSLLATDLTVTIADDLYRSLWIRGERVQISFSHAAVLFDVAAQLDSDRWFPPVYARLQQGVGFDPDQPLSEVFMPEELPALVFRLDDAPGRLLRANSAYLNEDGWQEGLFSKAVVFEPTDERADPNEHVYAVDR